MHYLRKHLVGKRITSIQVQDDNIVYGKVGTSASEFQKAITGKRILSAGQQGKYFYLVCDSPPHPVMHLGMTGWMRFNNDDSSYYKPEKEKPEDKEWPPRFWKFILKTEEKNEIAFVDARRLARIRLVDAPGDQLRNTSPLKENGPDPVIDKEILTAEWFANKLKSKKVPVKALLLDQANISGVGNWVADEVLYQARIHPEQYSNTFSDEQMQELHRCLIEVCTIAVDTMSEQSKFPESWIMKYRWDKGKKDGNVLPNGEKITHLTVGGRTSAVVLSRQKKTGAVAPKAEEAEKEAADGEDRVDGETETSARPRSKKRKSAAVKEEKEDEEVVEDEGDTKSKKTKASTPKKSTTTPKKQKKEEQEEQTPKSTSKKSSSTKKSKAAKQEVPADETPGRRRSTRLKN